VIAVKDAALKARSQTLLDAMEHAEHWKRKAGEWQQLAEQSAEQVKALTALTQPGAAHGKGLLKRTQDVEVCCLQSLEAVKQELCTPATVHLCWIVFVLQGMVSADFTRCSATMQAVCANNEASSCLWLVCGARLEWCCRRRTGCQGLDGAAVMATPMAWSWTRAKGALRVPTRWCCWGRERGC
jgi:hypothetical protein